MFVPINKTGLEKGQNPENLGFLWGLGCEREKSIREPQMKILKLISSEMKGPKDKITQKLN